MNEFTQWIMAKILNGLINHDGVKVEDTKKYNDCIKSTFRDSLGFRYELELKCIGRLNSEDPKKH